MSLDQLYRDREKQIRELEAEIAVLKEFMDCGHPKACWQSKRVPTDGRYEEFQWYCTVCERARLERTVVLQQAASLLRCKCGDSDCQAADPTKGWEDLLALIPPANRSLLDAYVQQKVNDAVWDEREWFRCNGDDEELRHCRIADQILTANRAKLKP